MPGTDNITQNDNIKIITLDSPFKRGEKMVEKVTVRRPNVGALRGTSLGRFVAQRSWRNVRRAALSSGQRDNSNIAYWPGKWPKPKPSPGSVRPKRPCESTSA